MQKPEVFYQVILDSADTEAVFDALAESGHDSLAQKIASCSQRSETDRQFIAGLPDLYENDFAVDDDPIVSPSDIGAYVMVWCWVNNADAGIPDSDSDPH